MEEDKGNMKGTMMVITIKEMPMDLEGIELKMEYM